MKWLFDKKKKFNLDMLSTFDKMENLLDLLRYYEYFEYLICRTYIIFAISVNVRSLHRIIDHSPNLMITLIGGSFGNLKVIHANFSTITYSTLTDINLGCFFSFFRVLLQWTDWNILV